MLKISPTAKVSPLAHIEESVNGSSIVVGDNVLIDSFVRIKPVGGCGDVVIGANSFVNSGTVIFSGNGVLIGSWVLIAPNCSLVPVNHSFDNVTSEIRHQGFMPSRGGILIEDDVWIGAGSVLLDGAVLRKGCVIGAGSLVKSEVPSNSVWAGNPLRKLRDR